MTGLLPIELLNEIVLHLCSPSEEDIANVQPGDSPKPEWADIAGISMASHKLRNLVLQAWFRTLCISSPEDLIYGDYIFPDIKKSWTRYEVSQY